MDIRFPIAESIDDLLRYGVSGGVLLSYLILSFPDQFEKFKSDWHYFVIFSFIIGFLIFIFTRFYVDHTEERDYYRKIIQDKIPRHIKKLKKPISNVHLTRALENYYFWSKNKRGGMSKIQRRASYIYFYLSMSIVFIMGSATLFLSLILQKYYGIQYAKFSWEFILIIALISAILPFYVLHRKYKKTYKDQKYIWYIAILNELEESPENFEDFIVSVYETNKKWKIIDKFLGN